MHPLDNVTRPLLLMAAATILSAQAASAGEIVWWVPNWQQARAEELAKTFEAANPDQTIKLEITVADGLQNRVLVALRSGTTPDLIEINQGWNIPYAHTGELLALDDRIAASGLDLDDWQPVALETVRLDGKIYGVPYRMEAHATIYNKAMYREAGLDPERPPETWTELLDYAKKLTRTKQDGQQQYGYGIAGGGEVQNLLSRSLPFIWMNGGDIISSDDKRATVNEPAAVEAVQFYAALLTKYQVAPPSTLQNDGLALRRLFVAGTLASYQAGLFDVPAIQQENPNIEIGIGPIPHPEGKEPAATLGGWNFVIPKAAKNPDGAWKLIAFLADSKTMGFYTDTFPARKSAMTLPRFQTPEHEPFKAMLPYARRVPPVPAWVQIVQTYFDHVQGVLLEDMTAQEAMDEAAAEIQDLLDQ